MYPVPAIDKTTRLEYNLLYDAAGGSRVLMEAKSPPHDSFRIYHANSYPAISPKKPSLSTQDKTIVIAGVSNVPVGRAIAESFAESGAKNLALLGDSEPALMSCTADIKAEYPAVNTAYFVTAGTSTETIGLTAHQIRSSVGAWDVFVQAAAHSPVSTTIVASDTDEFWQCFEQTVRPIQHYAKHFMPKKRPNATYISLVSMASSTSANDAAGFSAIAASQAAVMKLNQFLAVEHPHLGVFSVDPGEDFTARAHGGANQSAARSPSDGDLTKLCRDFCVWLAAVSQNYLRGRFLRCNWDTNELTAM